MSGVCVVFLGIAAFFPLLLLAAVPVALLGVPALVYSWAVARRTCLVITTERVRIETGLVVRTTEIIDFVRVQDVALSRAFGWETLVMHGTDVRTPRIEVCFHGAAKVFEEVRAAVQNARSKVMAVQQI
jgi:membrane protein YdbS with pleckstrin-like domain